MENGEIDLIDLYGAFKKTITYRLLNNAFNLITGNRLWFIAFIAIGITAGYSLSMNKAPLFKTEMLIESVEINNYVSENMITGLNSLINQGNYSELSKNGLSKAISYNIDNIEFIPAEIIVNTDEKNIFKLELELYDIDSLKQIETILTNYLNNTAFSRRLKEENLDQYNSEIKELLTEIKELDNISSLINTHLKSDQNLIHTSLSTVPQEKLKAKVRIIELDRMILNSNNYHVLNGFIPTNSPEPLKGNYPLKFGFLSFIFGFIILRIFKR